MDKTEKWSIFKSVASSTAGMLASSAVSGALTSIFAIADAITGKNVSTFRKVTRFVGTSLIGSYVGSKVEDHMNEQLSEYDMAVAASEGAATIEYATAKAGE